MGIIRKIRIKLGMYDLEEEGATWVAKNIGEEYVQEFRDKYETICRGGAIGGVVETATFLDMIGRIKRDLAEDKI
jgi:hypothetical protein